MSSAAVPQAEKLSLRRKAGFGVGDFGFNLYYTGLNLFLYYYYTDILEIRPGIAGLIFAIPLIWDGVTDPLMGVIASRTRTRLGSYRPYILFGAPLLALSFVGMFAAPLLFPTAVVAVSALAHILFRTCYTIVSIPYTALSANMTRSSRERGDLAGIRMIFASIGALMTVFLTLTLAARFGAGDMKLGFFWVSVVYATTATAIFMVTFLATSEREHAAQSRATSFEDTARLIRRNRALWVLIAAILVSSVGSTIFGKALVYYVKYVAGLELSITQALLSLTAASALSIPVWTIISRFISKRTMWLCGAAITISMQTILFLAPPATPAVFMTLLLVIGCSYGAFVISFWSMLPDTVEYGEWHSGVRDEGVVFGLNQLALKASSGLGIGLLGLLLELSGYVANETQAPATLAAMRTITVLLPLLCSLGAAALIAFYPITAKAHRDLVEAIDARARESGTT